MRSLYGCLVVAVAALAGCAQASGTPGDDSPEIDAGIRSDSGGGLVDSGGGTDAPTACTTMTRNLLRNSNFDATPDGVDWNATPIDANYPIVTADAGGVPAQGGTIRAWMGGLERPATTNKDNIHQDVAVPPMTTKLELTGYYEVRTGELDGNVYDRAVVELTSTTNTQLELIQALDDNGATTAWTAFTKTFTGNYSGQTVRLRMSTTADSIDATSFFFDTLELNATFCQ